jgi:hypothetical protein
MLNKKTSPMVRFIFYSSGWYLLAAYDKLAIPDLSGFVIEMYFITSGSFSFFKKLLFLL